MTTVGPAWTQPGTGGRYAGRFPLAVERQVMGQVGRLLPGVTTVTPHGRYYALHGLIAHAAADRSLSDVDAQTLLRRAEVALAAVSVAHEHALTHEGLGRAHGVDAISAGVHAGMVEVDKAASMQEGPGRYAKAKWGFLGQYRGSETLMGILDASEFRPGPRFDASKVAPALGDILDLAERGHLDRAALDANAHLCVCAGAEASDGRWLADLLVPSHVESAKSRVATRRDTVRMVVRLFDLADVRSIGRDAPPVLMYGAASQEDPTLRELLVTQAWKGTALRAESVAQWRALWAWLVRQVDSMTSRTNLADAFADALPDGTVQAFVDTLPPLRDESGYLYPAEIDAEVRALAAPHRALAVIAVGGLRAHDLDGEALLAFRGTTAEEAAQQLAPNWVASRLTEWADRSLRDFARDLTGLLLDRAQRISFAKATRDRNTGLLKIPSRVHLRDEWVFKDSDEGAGPVSLRWEQLSTVLAEAGVVARRDGRWLVTERGRDVLR